MYYGRYSLVASTLFLAACGSTPDHSNTLIFGTETKIALDVSSSTTTTAPEVTLGYKRKEAVWLPLLANKKNANGKWEPQKCGSAAECHYRGGENVDAYSVLASFGAKFNGKATAKKPDGTEADASAEAGGGISQYFATGIAAQILAKEGGASLVSVQSGNAAKALAEKAEAEVKKTEAQIELEAIKQSLGTTAFENAANKGQQRKLQNSQKIAVIMAQIAPDGALDCAKLTDLVDNHLLKNDTLKQQLGSPITALKTLPDAQAVQSRLQLLATPQFDVNPLDVMLKGLFCN